MLNKMQGSDLKPLMEGRFSVLEGGIYQIEQVFCIQVPFWLTLAEKLSPDPKTWERQRKPTEGMISLSNESTKDPAVSGCNLKKKKKKRFRKETLLFKKRIPFEFGV